MRLRPTCGWAGPRWGQPLAGLGPGLARSTSQWDHTMKGVRGGAAACGPQSYILDVQHISRFPVFCISKSDFLEWLLH